MTLGGWITMLLSVGFVTGLLAWTVSRVLRTPRPTGHLHARPEIDAEHDEGSRTT